MPPFVTRRRLVRAGIAVVALALLWSSLALIVPATFKSRVEGIALESLGRRLTMGEVAFNPWTLALRVDDVALAGPNEGAPPQLQIKQLRGAVSLGWVVRFAPVIDRLEIDAPVLRLTRSAEGRYDIDDVLQRLAARPAKADDEPPQVALHNIVVRDGSADFVDVPAGVTHKVRALELGVPFISSLPAQREINVEPRLAFTLDGSRFDSAAVATPFAERGAGDVKIRLDRFDVGPWLGYLPKSLPVRLQSGVLNADLSVAFEQRPALTLRVRGSVGVTDLKVADAQARELLQVGSIKVQIEDLRPLERIVKLARIDIEAPHLLAQRNAAGRVNLLLAAETGAGEAVTVARVPLPSTAASAAARPASAASGAAAPPAVPGWKASLAALSLRAGRLDWRDATTSPEAALAVQDFSLDAQAIGWPLDAPVVFKGEGMLGAAREQGKLAFSGQGNAAGATVKLALDALPLALARPYLRALLQPPLAGALSSDLTVEWKPGAGGPQLRVDASRIVLANLLLGDAKAPELAAEQIELLDARVDTAARSATLGKLGLRAPRLRVDRDAEGRWNALAWQAAASAPASASLPASAVAAASAAEPAPRIAAASAAAPAASAAAPWRLSLGALAIDKGRVRFTDRALAVPAALDLDELALQLDGWALDTKAAVPFQVRAKVAVPAGPSGRAVGAGIVGSIDARGELKGLVAGAPQSAKATLALKDLPLHLLDPYLDGRLNLDVQKAQASFKGTVAWEAGAAGANLALRGDASVDDFRATSPVGNRVGPRRGLAMVREGSAGPALLSWKSLSLRGIDVALAGAAAPRVAIAETALSDFFARVVLDEQGRLNLQEVARAGEAASAPGAAASAASVAVVRPASPAASGPAPIIDLGPISVVNGRIAFNDRFVKPNYSANLSELSGRLGAFSSQTPASGPPQLADLELRGRVEGTASLEITGKVNPLARPLALDIKAKVRDLELPPLSPYAIKYSGYGIDRGKLSVDLAYLVQPDGQLTASNRIVLHQLAFGDKVEGSTASLPVKLAVALLADQHGVIDLDLPVSGSINDPQFSVVSLVFKVIGNLILKAVTAPFALLSGAGAGGGGESSVVAFAPGAATLSAEARESLDKIAKALLDRPALTLTVTGESRLESEREAWKRERLQQAVRAEKRRQAIAGGANASAEVTVAAAEYPALLKEVYRRADIVKPKNALGLTQDLPPAEMETLLLAGIVVPDDAMQQLAVRRAVVVRDYLATRELPTSRLFLGAPKTAPGDDAAWTPRADLKLTLG
ncbi:MAG: DUF748 domain-containing protein [Burkholderiales bacterium]|nr:DUF748 domain-containing protein [Burkholderiales bacterium]